MKKTFYLQLAWTGIGKNRKLYFPYLITCIGMVMMYYIITSLSISPVIGSLYGGDAILLTLSLGSYVVAFFSILFLFYSNSFLIRRRKMEFGLYNILGMGKGNIGRILLCELVITALITLVAGLGFGLLFSKLGELFLVNMMQGDVVYSFSVEWEAISRTLILFPLIFLGIFIFNVFNIHVTNPIELLHSETAGEKAPKANYLIGFAGFVLLGLAYYIAVTIEQPVAALVWFFLAVIMVIAATYLIFIAGSVLLCRLLQKNKNYYYKAEHFTSVSSMLYRMKRNGAGLASICILATMVLVMIAFTSCLFFGLDDNIKAKYPYDININAYCDSYNDMNDGNIERLSQVAKSLLVEKNALPKKIHAQRNTSVLAKVADGKFSTGVDAVESMNSGRFDGMYNVVLVSYDDFFSYPGAEKAELARPAADELVLLGKNSHLKDEQLSMDDGSVYKLIYRDDLSFSGTELMDVVQNLFFVVADVPSFTDRFTKEESDGTVSNPFLFSLFFGIDLDENDERCVEINEYLHDNFSDAASGLPFTRLLLSSPLVERSDYYTTYGGLFFLGIMLSIVFLFATILIVYYKQISEGFEDQSRFEIMQKVGMTKEKIRKSINSQMLTVFFLPLLMAGLHLVFAFPMIQKVLIIFGLVNLNLLIFTSAISFLLFSVFYVIVYKITTNTYYGIAVSSKG
ncbi:MAG: ABC transporter permease [Treponemataceae bacterium]|nr:ABC transporter permease [Treponemataceae bacterium]